MTSFCVFGPPQTPSCPAAPGCAEGDQLSIHMEASAYLPRGERLLVDGVYAVARALFGKVRHPYRAGCGDAGADRT